MKISTLVSLFLLWSYFLFSQEIKNFRERKVALINDTLTIDTLSIIPQSLEIKNSTGQIIDPRFYDLNYPYAQLIFSKDSLAEKDIHLDTIYFSYQVFPYLFSKPLLHKDFQAFNYSPNKQGAPYIYSPEPAANDIFKTEGLNKTGSISRGIAFGNNQDVVVNSNLNLQLSGKLNNNIDVLLAASDDNIPIQPDGNTQSLQEFDKVFIQLSDPEHSGSKLVAGDFQLARPEGSYFMNFNKKARGLNFSSDFKKNGLPQKRIYESGVLRTNLSAAVSKGKFARNQITGIEGNQGPYHLKGNENEPFIVILSGTEKVYLDGELLQRGQDKDYVIDYNTAGVSFTPKRLITKDKRIIVEFQYSDKN